MGLPVLLNQLQAVRTRILIPATGAWIADVDFDFDGVIPTGPCVLTVGTTPMVGTIDPRSSGAKGARGHVQVIGGGGGWDTIVPALHLHNDAGVLTTQAFSVTAATVGEVVTDTAPMPLGVDYVRTSGPASRVFAGFEWYVDVTGITIVGPRIPTPFDPTSIDILDWDPITRVASLASDSLVLPGTVLVDIRFGTATIRDVEIVLDANGARCTAWCTTAAIPLPIIPGQAKENAGNRLARALGAMAREAVGVQRLKVYGYRIVVQNPADGRCTLQNTTLTSDAPAQLLAIDVRPGMAGTSGKFAPGTEVSVAFIEGDFSRPVIVGFGKVPAKTLEIDIDALRVAIGLGTEPVAKAPEVIAALNAIQTELAAHAAAWAALAALTGPIIGAMFIPVSAPVAGATTAGAAAVAAANATLPSTKLFTE